MMSKLAVTVDGQRFEIDVTLTPACNLKCTVKVNGEDVEVLIPDPNAASQHVEWLIINGRPYELTVGDDLQWLRTYSGIHSIDIQDREAGLPRPRSGDGRIKAPIPGLVTRVLVQEGDKVEADQAIIVLEAMKMENEIRAPFNGEIHSLAVTPGETVVRNAVLAEVR
jgi:biotin carboxyl carrier protein